jgi:tetratricopeptide (TPR) repeat protein
VAYERLGRLDEAARAIPAYMAAEPENAGPALQSLYVSLTADVEQARQSGDNEQAQRKADLALLLARQIFEWAGRNGGGSQSVDRSYLLAQLAEANLLAGRFQRARELFEQCGAGAEGVTSTTATDGVSARFGHAESLFRLREFAEALPEFNRLALELPETDPIRWKSLLRDLECRTALKHPPGDIIRVIEQQRYLFPDLGGPHLAPQFEKLLRENQRRPDRE